MTTTTKVPYTAFCPECAGRRTFTIIGTEPIRIGCCICGTSERDALVALTTRATDDRDSLGEIAARLNTLDGEVTELRDDHLDLARAHDRLYDKVRAQQTSRLLRDVTSEDV
jgi:hypothetical protein